MTDRGRAELPDRFEEIPCPLCGERPYTVRHIVRDRLETKAVLAEYEPRESDYQIVVCSSCGFLFLNPRPRPEFLAAYYQAEGYDPHQSSGGGLFGRLFRGVRQFTIRWKYHRVSAGRQSGELLDIGCGTGEFMAYAHDHGWQCTGIEADANAADIAGRSGCRVHTGDPTDIDLLPGQFDIITMWHSLEHLPWLRQSFEKICQTLKPGGTLAIAVPNPASFDAEHYGEQWVAWDAPRHLYHFRIQDIKRILEEQTLSLEQTFSLPLDPFYHCLLSEFVADQRSGKLLKLLRGGINGTIGLIKGRKVERASSILYICTKK